MRRTSDAITSLGRPARRCDRAAENRTVFIPSSALNRRGRVPAQVGFRPECKTGQGAIPLQIEVTFDRFGLRFRRDAAAGFAIRSKRSFSLTTNTNTTVAPVPIPFIAAFGRFVDASGDFRSLCSVPRRASRRA